MIRRLWKYGVLILLVALMVFYVLTIKGRRINIDTSFGDPQLLNS